MAPTTAGTAGRGCRARAGSAPRASSVTSTIVEPDHAVDAALSGAYHAKYDRYGRGIVGTVVSPDAERATLRVVPR